MAQALRKVDLPATHRLDVEEWARLPEDMAGELVDGYLEEEEVPDYVHELLVALLVRLFGNWAFPHGGLVAGSDAKFAIDTDRGRKPDLSVYFPEGGRPQPRGAITTPPDLMMEVVSASPRDGRRDRVEKFDDYARFGVRFYWILDPQLRSLEIFELGDDGRYARALGADSGTLTEIPGCEGLELDLDQLWEAIDDLDPEAALAQKATAQEAKAHEAKAQEATAQEAKAHDEGD